MKKSIAFLIVLTILSQFCFSVTAEDAPVFELDLSSFAAGAAISEGAYHASSTGTITVQEDENEEKYVAIRDHDDSTDMGYYKDYNFDGIKTISFDYRLKKESKQPGRLYLGMAVTLFLRSAPQYYDGEKNCNMGGEIILDDWINVTVVTDSSSDIFDVYLDGQLVAEDVPCRKNSDIGGTLKIYITGYQSGNSDFDFKNLKIYHKEVVPPLSEKAKERMVTPDRTLVDYLDSGDRMKSVLSDAVAMTVGNSIARVNNSYVPIDPDNRYVAPFVTSDGYTLIPTRFTTETIGCTTEVLSATSFRFSKDGTVMEINMGDKNAIINGTPVEMPAAPVIKHDRLFIPLRFAAETYGKNVFWDDRGLIIISDKPVVSQGQEDIIKPLITEIRNYTTLLGNKKYSDVNFSARLVGTFGPEGERWGALDAAKRFMATVNRWTYNISGDNAKSLIDLGVLNQGTLNANANGEYAKLDSPKNATTYFLSGTPYTRADGGNGTTWGCVNNPYFMENLKKTAADGIDLGLFVWQFDDWVFNCNYRLGGCHCKYCNEGFKEFVRTQITSEEKAAIAEQGITDTSNFDYIEWLKTQGVLTENDYSKVEGTAIDHVRDRFNMVKAREFHDKLTSYMEELLGSDIFYSINLTDSLKGFTTVGEDWLHDYIDGVMGETKAHYTKAEEIYALMLISRAIGREAIISPLPKDKHSAELMYSGIPMTYATGQHFLVPWDTWLFGSTRYYATLEELGGLYELPREYPFLFDNYEIPEAVGYLFDINSDSKFIDVSTRLLNNGVAAKSLVRKDDVVPYTFEEKDLRGLQALVYTNDNLTLTEAEKTAIDNSGILKVSASDTASIEWLENTYWTVKDNDSEVYSILRQNQLYDNAPVVVHAVNYNSEVKENVELEINNLWLPAGDKFTINVYKPGENYKTISAAKGNGTTKIVIDSVDRWTVLEICGPETVRREVSFNLGEGYNGIGLGTRLSKDKIYGTPDDFTIVTYSEGINSTTYGDKSGTQDEAAFVYSRMNNSKVRKSTVNAKFGDTKTSHGVMVREGLFSNAAFVALMYDEANGLRLAERAITNKGVKYTQISKEKPAYMQLVRNFDGYTAFISNDGENYTEVGNFRCYYNAPVGGVFAYSPEGSRAECNVRDFWTSGGNYLPEDFDSFKISYGNGTVEKISAADKLKINLSTENCSELTADDVPITYESSREDVLKVGADGTLYPISLGKSKVTATARMGLKRITASTTIEVIPANTTLLKEDFEGGKLPDYMRNASDGEVTVKSGVLHAKAKKSGQGSDVVFNFPQRNLPTVFEFDFRAKLGKESPTTGARVIYLHGMTGMAITADKDGFKWFYGNDQRFIAPMDEDVWYHIKVEANYDGQWANVYINDKKVVDKGETRGVISPTGDVQLGGWRLGTDSYYEWDNLNFYFADSFE